MYSVLKKITKLIIPKRFLYKNELFFRSIFAFHYRGKEHNCTICNQNVKGFITLKGRDLLCPFCGSRSRTRRLYQVLQEKSLLKGTILHFSPSRSLYRVFKNISDINYYSTDYEDEFIAEYHYDITQIDCKDNTFDLILCYHILEHIIEDEKAIRELHRVLKPNGICFIQTPFKEVNDIFEDLSISSKEDRLIAFGQEDHVRVYSVEGLVKRLKENLFEKVVLEDFEENSYFGFKKETIIMVQK